MSNPPPEPGCNYQYLHLDEHKDMLCELVSKHCDTDKLFNFYKLKYCHLSGSPYLTFTLVVIMMYIFFRYNQYIVNMFFTPALKRLRVKTKMSKDLFGLVIEPLIYGLGGLIITITSCLDNIDAALPVGGMFGYNILELGLLMGLNTFLIKDSLMNRTMMTINASFFIVACVLLKVYAHIGHMSVVSSLFLVLLYALFVALTLKFKMYSKDQAKREAEVELKTGLLDSTQTQVTEVSVNEEVKQAD
jgi:Ca2+/Na+ antiporter